MSETLLKVSGLTMRFGGLLAVDQVEFDVRRDEVFAIIGPNGAGKTTLINLLTGYLEPSEGRVELMGRDVTRMPQYERARLGLVRTFQINQLFMDMTVLESVALAVSERSGLGTRWWRPLSARGEVIDEAAAILERLKLLSDAHATTRNLAYGRQRLIEIALALALRPKVLLLDEPAAGVPTGESQELFETIAQLPRDVTILLIEHDMNLVFRFAERISVLVSGALLLEDAPEVIAHHPRVKEVYLGEAHV
jgi:ABC-type branched-subunit amino acid transport system ATPase component